MNSNYKKEKYLEAKKRAGRSVSQAKFKAERKTFCDLKLKDDKKVDVF